MSDAQPDATVPDAAEAVARRIASWMRYRYDGLHDHSVVERGFPEWLGHYQGGKTDLLRFARELIGLAREAGTDGGWTDGGEWRKIVAFWKNEADLLRGRVTRRQTAIEGAIEAIERDSTSAPVMECLKAAIADDPASAPAPVVSVKPMALADGRVDYFVSIEVGDREVTPHVFREEYKAAYHVALYDWLLNGCGEEPDVLAFGPDDWPARVPPSSATAKAKAVDFIAWLGGYLAGGRELDADRVGYINGKLDALSVELGILAPGPAKASEADDVERARQRNEAREVLIARLARKFPGVFTPYGSGKAANALAGNVADEMLDALGPDLPVPSAETARLRGRLAAVTDRLREAVEENCWNAYACGIVRDGKWMDGGMSDAERLRRELGLEHGWHDCEAVKRRLPEVVEKRIAALTT